MSTSFYERLSAISTDSNDGDGMTELVVAALGSFGRYYICWKTQSGEYKQESSGLPPPLQKWLFPTNGHARDYATLQVVLGRGDDFFASDSTGKVENKAAADEQLHHHHNRHSSLDRSSLSSSNNQDLPAIKPLDRASRRRSRTISMIGPPSAFRLTSEPSISPIIESHTSSGPADAAASTSAAPTSTTTSSPPSLAAAPLILTRHHRDWKRRPRSIAFGEGATPIPPALSRSPPAPKTRSSSRSDSVSSNTSRSSTTSRSGIASSSTTSRNAPAPCCHCTHHTSPPPPRPSYVSTSTQTTPPPSPPSRRHRQSRRRSPSPYYSSSDDDADYPSSTASSSRRSSAAETDITTSSTYAAGGGENPVVMGKMQSYFRSTGYQLGDALRPAWGWGMGWGYGEQQQHQVGGLRARAWSEVVLDRRRTV